jgi:hypothetical protein
MRSTREARGMTIELILVGIGLLLFAVGGLLAGEEPAWWDPRDYPL